MLRDHFLVFEDVVLAGQVTTSPTEFDRRLGAYDQLAILLDVRELVSTGNEVKVQAAVQHSSDCIRWLQVGTSTGVPVVAEVLEVFGVWVPLAGAVSDGAAPLLPYVRIQVYGVDYLGTFIRARVRVFATLRDSGGGRPHGVPRLGGVHAA